MAPPVFVHREIVMTDLDLFLAQQGFDELIDVRGLDSIVTSVTRKKRRSGVYVLHFADGSYYAGKARDCVVRFRQHVREWPLPIERISIRWLAQSQIAEFEQALIHALEAAGVRLRNKEFMSVPAGPAAFDDLMPEQEQQRWLTNPGERFSGERWAGDSDLRFRYQAQYQQYLTLPHAEEVTTTLREYVQRGIPAFGAGEFGYWSVSCLPATTGSPGQVYARINIFWQEVFVVWVPAHRRLRLFGNSLLYEIQLAKSPLEAAYGRGLGRLRQRFNVAVFEDIQYKSGGYDQIRLQFASGQAVRAFLDTEPGLQAVRRFNLNLTRKGRCNSGRSHCLDLADQLVI